MTHPNNSATTTFTRDALFHLLVDSVQDYAIFVLDPEGTVATWNSGAQRLKGYAPSEIVGKHFSTFYTEADVAAGVPGKKLETAEREGRVQDEGWRVRKDGTRFWAMVVITALRDPSGRLVGFAKVTRDVTERKMAEERLRAANEDLEQRVLERTADLTAINRELEQFAYITSHDLQEPIRKVLINCERMAMETKLDDKQKQLLEKVANGGRRLKSIVHDLLQFSRLTQAAASREKFNLGDVIHEAVVDLEASISESGTKVEIGPMPDVVANRSQVRHIFQNLISNSVKFRRPGVPPRVEITSAPLGAARIRVELRDNGIGFEDEYADKIFEPFQRLHSRERYEGTGIGLSIVRKIVAQHRGSVSAHGRLGEGATFAIELPVDGAAK